MILTKRGLLRRRFAVLLGVFVAAGVGGVAYATIPGAGGVIHGCYGTPGLLRVIDDTSQSCRTDETALTWSQTGPPGTNGTNGTNGDDGTAVGYARVGSAGAVNPQYSKNVGQGNVEHPGAGLYCFTGLAFTPRSAVASGISGINAALAPTFTDTIVTVFVNVDPGATLFGCSDTATVRVRTIAAASGTTLVDRGFNIWFED